MSSPVNERHSVNRVNYALENRAENSEGLSFVKCSALELEKENVPIQLF